MVKVDPSKAREEARSLFIGGELSTNAEIALRLGLKPTVVGKWRREEDWDGIRDKLEARAAEAFGEKTATDRVSLNIRHHRMWDIVVVKLAEEMKAGGRISIRDLERIAAILDKAQRGQRRAEPPGQV